MKPLTLGQSAKLAGVCKTTVTRAINSGRMSAERQADGSYRIDPAELSRVYDIRIDETPPTVAATGAVVHRANPARDTSDTPDSVIRLVDLDTEVKALREMLARADQQADDRRQERAGCRSTRLLTDQRPARSWWKRLAG